MNSTDEARVEGAALGDGTEPLPEGVVRVPDRVLSRWRSTIRILGAELSVCDSKELRAVLSHEVAEFDERVLADEPAAARGYLSAFNLRPGFRAPLDALIRLYHRRKSVPNLVKLYEALARAAPSPRDRAEAITRRGELLEDRLSDHASARAAFEAAVEADPEYRPAWFALERVALRAADPELLARSLGRLAALTKDPSRRQRLLTDLAWELAGQGGAGEIDRASGCLRDAAEIEVGRWRALLELERFGERFDRPDDVMVALEGRAKLARDVARGGPFAGSSGEFSLHKLESADAAGAEAAALFLRAARLRLAAHGDVASALGDAESAVELQPGDTRVRYAAMSLADHAGDIERASEHAAWLLAQDFGAPSLRASLYFRLAEAAAVRGAPGEATDALREALALDPTSATVRGALVEQTVVSGDALQVLLEVDRLVEAAEPGAHRAALLRVGAVLALALRGAIDDAARRFRLAAEQDPADVISRRAQVVLLARLAASRGETEVTAAARVAAIDALLPHATDSDEKIALLVERLACERYEQGDLGAAAATAEQLVEATGQGLWALERAAFLRAAVGSPVAAAKWAEALGRHPGLEAHAEEAADWLSLAARWLWAARETSRAQDLALEAHHIDPSDPYRAALALRMTLASGDAELALEVASRAADARAPDEEAARWLLLAAALFEAKGLSDPLRRALDHAASRAPMSPTVRSAAFAMTRWRGDAASRARLVEAALDGDEFGASEVALAVELALLRVFIDDDIDGAAGLLERASARGGSAAPASALLTALVRGGASGPDAAQTIDALQALLMALPSSDPLRVSVEIEVARALGASASTRDQAAEARALVDEDRPELAAPRLLALLDVIQREGRAGLPEALRRVADLGDAEAREATVALGLAALRARGRSADARSLAAEAPDLTASRFALSELSPTLERAGEHARASAARGEAMSAVAKSGHLRSAANWASLAGDDEAALRHAEALIAVAPGDLVALDVSRVAGRRAGRWTVVASACEELAKGVRSSARAAALWEEAGQVALDHLGDVQVAERDLRNALDADPSRAVAYRKLREVLEARGDARALEALVTRRAGVVTEDDERVEIYWEQARLRRSLGLREGALESALRVVAIAPGHVAARALIAEIHAASGRLQEMAEALAALAGCSDAPPAQRKAARLGAVDLYDRRLNLPSKALDQLEALVSEGHAEESAIERGLEIAGRSKLWEMERRFARRLADARPVGPERVAGLLRAAAIERDHLHDAPAAESLAAEAHASSPESLEVLRVLLGVCRPEDRRRYGRRTVEAIRERTLSGAVTVDRVAGVAEAARAAEDRSLERAAQRCASWLGSVPAPGAMIPRGGSLRDPQTVLRYRSPMDGGRAVALLELVMPDLCSLAGLSLDHLRVGRSERMKGAHPLRSALEPFAAVAGIRDFEVYLGGSDPTRITVVPGDAIAVVCGVDVRLPWTEAIRFAIVRGMLLAVRGCGALGADRTDASVARAVAAMAAAELPIAGGAERFSGIVKPVYKAMSRRVRRGVADGMRPLAQAPDVIDEVSRAVRGVLSTARRGALVVSGAIDEAFQDLARVEGLSSAAPTRLVSETGVARDLLGFCLGDEMAQVARDLGVDRD